MVYYPVFRSQRGHGIGGFLQNFVKKQEKEKEKGKLQKNQRKEKLFLE